MSYHRLNEIITDIHYNTIVLLCQFITSKYILGSKHYVLLFISKSNINLRY